MNTRLIKKDIPQEWKKERFNTRIAFEYGKSLPESKRMSGTVPVYGSNGQVGWHSQPLIKGPGIIVGRKGTIGAIVWSESDFWPIDTTYYVGQDGSFILRWLYYKLQSLRLSKMNSASGTPGLNREEVYKLQIKIPPKSEQQKIAEILETVDEDITKTEEVIKATEKLKRGLMQQLFTRGIGHTKFKKTKIGEIPEEWEVGGFKNLVNSEDKNAIKPGPFGSSLKKSFYVDSGFKIYGQEQVISGNIYYGDYYINEEKYKELEGFQVNAGDILISLVGTIGKILIVPENFEKGIINPRLLKITPDKKRADSKFISHLLKSDFLIQQMNKKSHGGTMNILNKGMLMSVSFGVPSLNEQKKIAEILSAVDEKISVNKKLRAKLSLLKKGLMQDLLSGNKRVINQ